MDARLVVLFVCVTLVSAASKIPRCNDGHIGKINGYWSSNGGAPKKILDSKASYQVVSGTASPVAQQGKCKHFSFSKNGGSYTLNGHESNGHFPAIERNGVLTITVGTETFTNYIISTDDGMICAYKCSADGPEVTTGVVADVTISTSTATQGSKVSSMENTLIGMGFNVNSFNC